MDQLALTNNDSVSDMPEHKASVRSLLGKKVLLGVGVVFFFASGVMVWSASATQPGWQMVPNRSLQDSWTAQSCLETVPGFEGALAKSMGQSWEGFVANAKPTSQTCFSTCKNLFSTLSMSDYSSADRSQYSGDMGKLASAVHGSACRRNPEEAELKCTAIMVARKPNQRSLWSCTEGAKQSMKTCWESSTSVQDFEVCAKNGAAGMGGRKTQQEMCMEVCKAAEKVMREVPSYLKSGRWRTDWSQVQAAKFGKCNSDATATLVTCSKMDDVYS